MTESNDHSYFLARARQEREIANICEDNAVALAHLRMAEEYERRARTLPVSAVTSIADIAHASMRQPIERPA